MDPTLFRSGRAFDVFRVLRHEDPVHWQPARGAGRGFWVVSRYDDVVSVLRHPEIFSSEYGNILPTQDTRDPTAGVMTFTSDPPAHTRLRSLLMPALTPKMVEATRPLVSAIVGQVLDAVPREEPFDFMSMVAGRLPIAVACGLMGVPAEDWPLITDLTHMSHGTKEDKQLLSPTAQSSGFSTANLELLAYFSELVAKRRHEPGDDLVSTVVRAEVNGERLEDEEIAVNCFAVTLGGYQADRNAMGGAVLVLNQHPDQYEQLVADPSILPHAVEEVLRWTTPTLNLARVAMTDTEIAGVAIAANDRVSAWLYSANRDETVFPEPEAFRVARRPNRHLTFGGGNHFCAGAHVARLEMSLLLSALTAPGMRPRLADEPEYLHSHFQQGLKKLPVRLGS